MTAWSRGRRSRRGRTRRISARSAWADGRDVVVTACGMDTEMGKIARLLHKSKPAPAPLDKTVARLGKVITVTVIFVALALFVGSLLAGRVSFLESVMSAVAVAVAAIPEGMGAVVTVILALGVQRMASSRAVMRRLGAVESLGGCSVICSDKTGTLTENRMTVEAICTDFAAPAVRGGVLFGHDAAAGACAVYAHLPYGQGERGGVRGRSDGDRARGVRRPRGGRHEGGDRWAARSLFLRAQDDERLCAHGGGDAAVRQGRCGRAALPAVRAFSRRRASAP